MDLTSRVLEGELMDAPDLAPQPHHLALRGLQRVNQLSGTARTLTAGILRNLKTSKSFDAERPLRVLDLACGGGDVTLSVALRLNAVGLQAKVFGWDRSETAIEFARHRASSHPAGEHVRFATRDALSVTADDDFDIITCTLFLHHLSNEEAGALLPLFYSAARRMVIIDDLRRTQFGYLLARVGCQLLSRSSIVHVDGPLSVRAAFIESELDGLAQQAGLPPATWRRHWPQRFLMWWCRK